MSVKISHESMVAFCNASIETMINMLKLNMTLNLLKILKKIKADCSHITYIVSNLLPYGNLLFYRYVKQEYNDMLNSFNAFDIILHAFIDHPDKILELLEYKIFDFEYAAIVNKTDLEHVVFVFLQMTEYDEKINEYLTLLYPDVITSKKFVNHLVLYNLPQEIAVYMRKCVEKDMFTDKNINYNMIINSFQILKDKYPGHKYLRSRLLNVIEMIVKFCVEDYNIVLPSLQLFTSKLHEFYTIDESFVADFKFLDDLPLQFYLNIRSNIIKGYFINNNDDSVTDTWE
jgi:hypothetical protein